MKEGGGMGRDERGWKGMEGEMWRGKGGGRDVDVMEGRDGKE